MRTFTAKILVVVFAVCFMWSGVANAQMLKPFKDSPVGNVTDNSCIDLHVISWGGEYAFTFGNGNALRTAKGSIFDKLGLCFNIKLQNNPQQMLNDYMSGKNPTFRGTLGMVNAALPIMAKDPRTQPVIAGLLTRSTGGDAIVVREGIKTAADLNGKRIAIQAYGPHLYFLWRVLKTVGLSFKDVTLVWQDNLYGTNSPADAFEKDKSIDVAFMIIPDALRAAGGGTDTVCKMQECTRKGARILMTTKSGDKVIFDVFVVRSDYFNAHKAAMFELAKGVIQAQEAMAKVFDGKDKDKKTYNATVKFFAKYIIEDPAAFADSEGMYFDCTPAMLAYSETFFTKSSEARSFQNVNAEIQTAFTELGLMNKTYPLMHAEWDYAVMRSGGKLQYHAESPKYDEKKLAAVVTQKQRQGTLSSGQIFPTLKIFFKSNKNDFTANMYASEYDKAIDVMSTFGGAVMVVEGHSDPLGYLKAKKAGAPASKLKQIRQGARNLSVTRGNAVRNSIVAYAASKGITLDKSQFTVVGHGFEKSAGGMCGAHPCAPKSEQEWLSNMKVEFRIIQVETEASEFELL
ncbi:ABC transporter substrate-binding protein [Candidatus Kuenenbacteria bacterium]|nr:ABC transporter substrate-binding protein [Candidatus Kuenenbacteria bacterium]